MKLGLFSGWIVGCFAAAGLLPAQSPSHQVILGGDGFSVECLRIEPGTFSQGSPASEVGRKEDEPQRQVTLTRAFLLGKYPVTVGEFRQFVKETGYRTEAEKGTSGGFGWDGQALVQRPDFSWKSPGYPQTDRHPVTLVTWFDAQEYCRWLSRKTGRKISPPSEAQWEYACRSGSQNPYPEGVAEKDIAHSGTAGKGALPVDAFPPNSWGLVGMPGNVWEWCEDWFGPYESGPTRDPVQQNDKLSDKPRRVLRGGAFTKTLSNARSAARFRNDPRSRNADNGFRIMSFDLEAKAATPTAIPASKSSDPSRPPARVEAEPGVPPSSSPKRPLPSQAGSPAHPLSPPAPTGSGRLIFGLPCIAVVVGIFLALFGLIRRLSRREGQASPVSRPLRTPSLAEVDLNGPIRVEATDEGFWVRASVPEGTHLLWRCHLDGSREEREFAYLGGPHGQFIATGMRPSQITVVRAGTPPSELPPPPFPARSSFPEEDVPPYHSSHRRPSAY